MDRTSAFPRMSQPQNGTAHKRLTRVEGVLERLLQRLADATLLSDVNIAAGIAQEELSNGA